MKILLVTPPFVGPRTPYPATAYLKGFLKTQNIEATQIDVGTKFAERIFSRNGLTEIAAELKKNKALRKNEAIAYFLENEQSFIDTVEPAVRYLQDKAPELTLRISQTRMLPEIPLWAMGRKVYEQRVAAGLLKQVLSDKNIEEVPLDSTFESFSPQERAMYLATCYLYDVARVIHEGIDSRFNFMKYAPELAEGASSFVPLYRALTGKPTLIDRMLDSFSEELIKEHEPDLLGLTVPFPDCVYGAFRIAQVFRRLRPKGKVALGGGFASTALRELSDPKVFDFVDFITLDDGEKPLLCLIEHLNGRREKSALLRTFVRENDKVVLISDPKEHDIPQKNTGAPDYEGLPLHDYLATVENLTSPLLRTFAGYRWYRLTLAHGCYWKKCTFCDVHLDRIGRYEPTQKDILLERILSIHRQTGHNCFHFVDEAMPPSTLRQLSERLIEKDLNFIWGGMARFDKAFTPELTRLMAQAGCVMIQGGLEVASDRVLKLIDKGVSIAQAARAMRAFSEAGILVHAFLMYGFPSQTEQETIDALEVVRQLFKTKSVYTVSCGRFSPTPDSPVGRNPEKFGIKLKPGPKIEFARYHLEFEEPGGFDPAPLEAGLMNALDAYQQGFGLEEEVGFWFGARKTPKTTLPSNYIERILST